MLRTASVCERSSRSWPLPIAAVMLMVFTQFSSTCFAQDAGVPVDLTSTERTMVADQGGSFAPIEIDLGGTKRTVNFGDAVTAAEHVVVHQVLFENGQTLQLTASGAAASGTLSTAGFGSSIGNLVIPSGIVATHDSAFMPVLNIGGNLLNSGQILLTSSSSAISSVTINATNIFNQPGAVISTLPGTSTLNLTLNATDSIVNQGLIFASGNLSLTAGSSIANVLQTASASVLMAPVMRSGLDLNITAPLIQNAGTLTALIGNINIDAINVQNKQVIESLQGNISLTNSLNPSLGLTLSSDINSVISALNGIIETHAPSPGLLFDTTISGGSLLAKELIFDSGVGHVALSINDVGGDLSVKACSASIAVSNGTSGLSIKSIDLSGDPNLVYTGLGPFSSPGFISDGGQINIDTSSDILNGSITFTGAINTTPTAIGAGGNVILNAGTFISTADVITSGNAAAGGTVTMSALQTVSTGLITTGGGAVLLNGNGGVSTSGIDTVRSGLSAGSVSLTSAANLVVGAAGIKASTSGASGVAGAVTLKGVQGTVDVMGPIATSATTNGGTAGAVSIAANILNMSGTASITTSTTSTIGNGGDVFLVTSGSMTTGSILASGGTTAGSGGSIILSAGTSGAGSLSTLNLTSNGAGSNGLAGPITITSNGALNLGNISAQNSTGSTSQFFAAVGSASPAANLSTGSISLAAGARSGQVVMVNMSSGGNITTGNVVTSASAGNGGDISITANQTITIGSIVGAGPVAGGDVWLSAGATSGTAVSTGAINISATLSGGDLYVLRQPNATTALGAISQGGASPGQTFIGTPSGAQSSLTSNTTLSLSPGSVSGYNPGGFDTVNVPGTLTLNHTARVPATLVARTGNLIIGTLATVQPAGGTIDLVSTGNLTVGSLSNLTVPGLFRAVSTAGTVTLPSVNVSGTPLGGGIGVLGAQGVLLPNGNSLLASGGTVGGIVSLTAPAGSVTLGSTPNISGNVISVSGGQSGGLIKLVAGNLLTNNAVSLLYSGGVTSGRLSVTQLNAGFTSGVISTSLSSPSAASAAVPVAPGYTAMRQSQYLPVALDPTFTTGTILPTDTLPLEIGEREQRSVDSSQIVGAIPIVTSTTFSAADLADLTLGGVEISLEENGTLNLAHGAVVFAPQSRLTIRTHGGVIFMAPGTVALVHATEAGFAAYDLHDSFSGDLLIRTPRLETHLWPGAMMASGDEGIPFSELTGVPGVTFRKQKQLTGVGGNVFSADFSIQSVLSRIDKFSKLIGGSGKYQNRVAASLMKNAVIQNQVGIRRGRFENIAKQ